MALDLLQGKIIFWKKRFVSIFTFLVVFWVFCVFLIIFHTLKRNHQLPLSISIRITQKNDEIRPFGWIFTFWVKKLICILSFLIFFKITAYLIIFFLMIWKYIQRVISWFSTKVWKMIKNTKKKPKNDQKCKNQKKNYFFNKCFLPEGGLKPFFLLLILIDILKGYF